MKVQHRTRRRGYLGDAGTILVGETKYTIDENGIVDVSDEHAATMLQGSKWVEWIEAGKVLKAGQPGALAGDVPPPPAVDREREELLKRAADLGVSVDRRLAKHKILTAIQAEEERRKK